MLDHDALPWYGLCDVLGASGPVERSWRLPAAVDAGVGYGHRAHGPGTELHDFFGFRRTSTTTSTCPSADVIPFALSWG